MLVLASISWLGFDRAGREDMPRNFTIFFENGMAMQSDADERLKAVQAAMLDNPDYTALITGHTGTLGRAEANLELSKARADAVALALHEAGIDTERYVALSGKGREMPRSTNDLSWEYEAVVDDMPALCDRQTERSLAEDEFKLDMDVFRKIVSMDER